MAATYDTSAIGIAGERLYGRSAPTPDALDYGLFLGCIWLASGLGIALRLIGPVFVAVPMGFCLVYVALQRIVPPRLLSAYLALCFVYAILSAYQVMPTSWQLYFYEEAIVRQLVPIFGFLAFAWASKAYFRRRLAFGGAFVSAPIVIVLGLVVAPAVMFQQGMRYQGEGPIASIVGLYGAFINNIMLAMFFLTANIFLRTDWRRYAALSVVIAIAATTHFAQFRIWVALIIATLLGLPGRFAAMVLVAGFVSAYAVGLHYVPEMMIKSPNSGMRLAFISDALQSVADTEGIGIGFGRESVRWRYEFPNMAVFTFLPDPKSITPERMLEILSTGVHNSFVQASLRTGVVGCLLLVAAFLAAFPPSNLPRDVKNHAAIVFCMIFIACFVNPALESPVQVVAIGFVYGYLLALRASARAAAAGSSAVPMRPLSAMAVQ